MAEINTPQTGIMLSQPEVDAAVAALHDELAAQPTAPDPQAGHVVDLQGDRFLPDTLPSATVYPDKLAVEPKSTSRRELREQESAKRWALAKKIGAKVVAAETAFSNAVHGLPLIRPVYQSILARRENPSAFYTGTPESDFGVDRINLRTGEVIEPEPKQLKLRGRHGTTKHERNASKVVRHAN